MNRQHVLNELATAYRKAARRASRILKVHGGFSHQWQEANGKTDGIVEAANVLGISFHELEKEARKS